MGLCFDIGKTRGACRKVFEIIFLMNLVLLRNFSTLSEAELAKNLLEANGIRSMIQKGDIGAATRFSGAAGDANLFVKKEDYENALEILGDE